MKNQAFSGHLDMITLVPIGTWGPDNGCNDPF